jgi:hypothetical protein
MADDAHGSEPADTAVDTGPPRRPRVFVRAFVGVVLVACMAVGYIAMGRQKAAKQAEAIEAVVQAGGRVYLDYQWHAGEPTVNAKPPQAAWVRRLVGDAMLARAVAVDLRGVEQPDAVVQSLRLLPYLRHIDAGNTALSDASLSVWRRMSGLTGLDLQGTRITDAGVESLARLAQLTTLSLARTAISDKAVLALARLKRLERLDLSDTQVTPDALDRLRTLLPKCRINDE